MKNKIEESYNKCLNLFKEGKRDTEEYRKELENVIELAKDNNEFKLCYFNAKFRLAQFYNEKHKYDLSKKHFLELINDKNMEEFKLDAIMHHAYDLRILKKYDEAAFWYEKLSELSTSKYYDEAVLEGLAKCATMVNNLEKERENYYDSGTYIYFKLCTAFCSQCDAYYGGLPSCRACYSLEPYYSTVFNSRLYVN